MRRWGLCAVLGLVVAMPVGAQRVEPSRFATAVPLVVDTVPKTGRVPLPPGFVTQQAFVGFAGFSVGALAGGAVGAAMAPGQDGWDDLAGVLMGIIIGGTAGSSIAVYRFSNGKGYESNYGATLLGSVAGLFGGPLLWVTVPMGSTIGYNLARK
jgi:hypothetical protein